MRQRAFTLIELLIVVAIIAILAAIAVPNFLEAQTRAKVSRVKSDMRSLAVGIESYCTDYNGKTWPDANDNPTRAGAPAGPPEVDGTITDAFKMKARTLWNWIPLTTPISYVTTPPIDGFSTVVAYHYETYQDTTITPVPPAAFAFMASWGPDRITDTVGSANLFYDPTNGTVSRGDIVRTAAVRDPSYCKQRLGQSIFELQK